MAQSAVHRASDLAEAEGSALRTASGEPVSTDGLVTQVYEQLRALASGYLRRESTDPMLEPAVLVNEAYLRLASERGPWRSREHFFAVAAGAMRKVLIDHARRRRALKRGFGRAGVSIELVTVTGPRDVDIREVDEALTKLGRVNARAVRIVELRFFAGLTNEQVADVLGVSRKTVVQDWSLARRWLAVELSETPTRQPPAVTTTPAPPP